jgi:hypothetical protein
MKRMPVKSVVENSPQQKTTEQKARECQARIEIERKRAKQRQRALSNRKTVQVNLPEPKQDNRETSPQRKQAGLERTQSDIFCRPGER